ncbi:succinylglutamate desuccinylase/aspartoacylase domain-containing protein [Microbulbifer thermotolerans]|uniref:succinylglutamate desuccinylase/aspartoacylase domain-containing protein n=1 Tax=Microbulbifer thermotolerans TaxID=252514 RepID=UPI00224B262F|nr:succinylglutamate desuccinylase/aspartoacylase family protein [Microbulbifer thermotolerans]MCX2834228.1 succinylglutamate desuccinylase/aspartoacylase family protein [Microbulbifer thermotolerans]
MSLRPPLRSAYRALSLTLMLVSAQGYSFTETEENQPTAPSQAEELQADQPRAEGQGEEAEPLAQQPDEAPLPQAENLQLDQPIEELEVPTAAEETPQPPESSTASGEKRAAPQPDSTPAPEEQNRPLRLLGAEVPPATATRLAWSPSQHFEGVYSPTPVLVVKGAKPGPTLCLTAAVHGDELNGIETVRRVMYNLDANTMSGAVIGVPIVNLQGFHRGSRYLTDRRDLNRHFPGDPNGSSASRIAYSFFHEVISHCNAVVDLHTGSFYRTNLPQLRGDLQNPKVVKLTKGFGSTVVLHSTGAKGTLRRAAVEAGIPAVTLEAGAPMVLDERSVSHSVKGIRTLLNQLGMVAKFRLWGDPEPVYYNSTWQRATTGGIIFSEVQLGQFVRKGDLLGTVTNPITNVRTEIRSEYNGRILGMAMNQVVQPGFAAYHIGIQAPEEQISPPEEVTADSEQAVEESAGSGEVGAPHEAATPAADTENQQPPAEESDDD